MPIKVIDTLIPATNNFKVVNASNVAYNGGNLENSLNHISNNIIELDNIVKAVPKIRFLNTNINDPGTYEPELVRVGLNSNQYIQFIVETTSVGTCSANIYRRKTSGTTDANYAPFKTISIGKGNVIIDLGVASTISDYMYKISVTDSLGKIAETPWSVGEDQKQTYLEFRLLCSDVIFKSNSDNIFAKTTYGNDINTLKYLYSINYILDSHRYIYYNLTKEGNVPPIFNADNINLFNKYYIGNVNGGTTSENANGVDLDLSKFKNGNANFESGKYILTTIAVMSPQEINDNEITQEFLNNDCSISTELKHNIDILEANSIAVQITSDIGVISTADFLTVEFLPKTNIASLTFGGSLTAECEIYYDSNEIDNNKEHIKKQLGSTKNIVCTHGVITSWPIGRISLPEDIFNDGGTENSPRGNFYIKIQCKSTNPEATGYSSIAHEILFKIEKEAGVGSSYVKDGLVCSFDLINNSESFDNNTKIWNSSISDAPENQYGIQIYNSTNRNGKIEDEESESKDIILKLNANAFGLMYLQSNNTKQPFNPFNLLTKSGATGIAFETYMKSSCIGILKAKAVSMRNDFKGDGVASAGVSIGYNSLDADIEGLNTKYSLLENEWQHIVITVDIDNSSMDSPNKISDVTNLRPYPTIRIYVNGVLVKVSSFEYNGNISTIIQDNKLLPPLTLNGSLEPFAGQDFLNTSNIDSLTGQVTNIGECSLKILRVYNRVLSQDEVYANYMNCLSSEDKNIVASRNGEGLTSIYFIKNRQVDALDTAFWDNKKLINADFSILNSITKKKAEVEGEYGSKTTLVNCTMYCNLNGEWIKEDNVDVFLQGTSSLAYPVKNFQIKSYKIDGEERKKNKIYPPFQNETTGWYVKDYIYTLKCDYMEHSHRNNTPTACYYQDKVLDAVMEYCSDQTSFQNDINYSPARSREKTIEYSNGDEGTIQKIVHPYRDSIDGFPCVVYYYDNKGDVDINSTNWSETEVFTPTGDETYSGTYMFNIDKEGAQLGFELEPENDTEREWTKLFYEDNNGNKITTEILPCISYEGAANDNSSAAAFLPYIEKYSTIIEKYYKYLLQNEAQRPNSWEDAWSNDNINDLQYLEEFKGKVKNGDIEVFAQDEKTETWAKIESKYNYYTSTLEPRFTYSDEYEDVISENTYNKMTYDTIESAIDFVYSSYQDKDTFKKNFSKYFSFPYCLTYYLQMMLFTQVDNAGKNAMFDTWGDGKLYPRPYDMDTQMGLDNSGYDRITSEAELNIELSPSAISGKNVSPSGYGEDSLYLPNWKVTTTAGESGHYRYNSYNTSESYLWKSFGKHFILEITAAYAKLRSEGIYNVDNICKYIDDKTCNKIGETFYNKDASIKYFGYKVNKEKEGISYDPTYLRCVSGNRKNRYKQFLKERIAFLDSFFGYSSASNSDIQIRSNTSGSVEIAGNPQFSPLGISVYSPQYIKIIVGSSQATYNMFVSPSDSYEYDGNTYEGALFYIPTTGTDKEIVIYGAGNVKTINHSKDLQVSKFDISKATKLTDIDINGATSLQDLILGENAYIRKLDITNTYNLRSQINIEKCSNLESILANGSGISSIKFPDQSGLKELKLKNSKITKLELKNINNLSNDNIDLTGCDYLTSIILNNCVNISSINEKNKEFPFNELLNLNEVIVENCPKIEYINLSNLKGLSTVSLNGESINEVNFVDCQGNAFQLLDLGNLKNLKILNLKGAGTPGLTNKVILPRIEFNDLNLQGSNINRLSTDSVGIMDDDSYNFNGISFSGSGSLKLTSPNNPNLAIKNIKNLNGEMDGSLFYDCRNLESISSCNIVFKNAVNLFYQCSKLTGLASTSNENEFDLSECSSASSCFYNANNMDFESIKYVASKLKNCNNWSHFCYSVDSQFGIIPKDFFGGEGGNENITNISGCFRGCTFTGVEDGLLSNSPNIENIDYLFQGDSHLRYVPKNLFENCIKIINAREVFKGCSLLGTVMTSDVEGYNASTYGNQEWMNNNCIMMGDSSKVLYSSNVKIINHMFYGCSNIQPMDGLEGFFSGLTSLENASLVFYGCSKLERLEEGILYDCKNLRNLRGTFASTGIKILPSNLFTTDLINDNEIFNQLVNMEGCFANCSSLEGHLHSNFFKLTPKLTTIGATKEAIQFGSGGSGVHLPGIFANTKLSTCDSAIFNKHNIKNSLQDCSLMFYNGNNRDTNGRYLPKIEGNPNSFKGFTADDDINNISTEVPSDLFEGCSSLKSASMMFAGRGGITGIEYTVGNEGNEISIFEDCKNSIQNISGMFAKCSNLKNCSKEIFQGLSELITIDSIFAECSNLEFTINENIFKGCTKLSNCRAAFINTNIRGENDPDVVDGDMSSLSSITNLGCSIPASLFNDCRNSLTNVQYMFAGCKNLRGTIGTGYARINNLNKLRDAYIEYLYDIVNKITYDLESSLNNDFEYVNEETLTARKLEIEQEKFAIIKENYGLNDLNSLILDQESAIVGDWKISYNPEELNEFVNSESYTNSLIDSFENYRKKDTNKIVEVIQKGLLSDCTKLTNVEGMFYDCENLIGPIPSDMFYCTGKNNLNNIKSLYRLFSHCHRLTLNGYNNDQETEIHVFEETEIVLDPTKDIDSTNLIKINSEGPGNYENVYPLLYVNEEDDSIQVIYKGNSVNLQDCKYYFVPTDWLSNVPNLENISEIFNMVGNLGYVKKEDGDEVSYANYIYIGNTLKCKLSVLELPDELFDKQARIVNASGSFSHCSSLGRTILSKNFLSKSLNYLSDISQMFNSSEIQRVDGGVENDTNTLFLKSSKNNTLTNIKGVFAWVNKVSFKESNYNKDDKGSKNDNGLTGYATDFTNTSKFGKIASDKIAYSFAGTNVEPYNSGNEKYSSYTSGHNSTYTYGIVARVSNIWDGSIKGLTIS